MKITKARIKQLIQEEIKNVLEQEEEEGVPAETPAETPAEAPESSRRVDRATKAASAGGMMDETEYLDLLKRTFATDKATTVVKAKALDALFPGKGRALLSLLQQGEG